MIIPPRFALGRTTIQTEPQKGIRGIERLAIFPVAHFWLDTDAGDDSVWARRWGFRSAGGMDKVVAIARRVRSWQSGFLLVSLRDRLERREL